MQRIGTIRSGLLLGAAVLVAVVAVVYAARSGGAYAAPTAADASTRVVQSARSAALHKTILVNRRGRTLYTSSAEVHGRLICSTKFCLSLWTPLVVSRGTTPTGAQHLAAIRRPDGHTEVTYRGRPLYTFNQDGEPGDVKGNGFKDVGIWLAATPSATTSQSPPPGGGSGYRYG